MSDEDKTTREKRKALLFDGVVGLLAIAIFLQVSIPAMIPMVEALKGSDAPAQVATAPKAPAK